MQDSEALVLPSLPTRSVESVMIKRSHLHWCFTINHPTDADNPHDWEGAKYIVWQLELGESKTLHHQGYVSWNTRKSLMGVKKVNARAHWEPAKGSAKQNTVYCTKEEGRVEGPWTLGEMTQGTRTDMGELKLTLDAGASILEVSQLHFSNFIRYKSGIKEYIFVNQEHRGEEETRGICLYGPTGSGKTTLARRMAGESVYWKAANKWWTGYTQQETVVLDEFYGYLAPHNIQRLLNHSPLIVETKGGHAKFNSKLCIFTSNHHPSEWWPNANISVAVKKSLERRFIKFVHCKSIEEHIEEKPKFTIGYSTDHEY